MRLRQWILVTLIVLASTLIIVGGGMIVYEMGIETGREEMYKGIGPYWIE